MNKKFKIVDIIYIAMMILPIVFSIFTKVVMSPDKEGIVISGALIFFTVDTPWQAMPITESQLNSLMVMISIMFLCLYLTHGIKSGVWLKRHHFAEMIVTMSKSMVRSNMGEYFSFFAPFIASIIALSAFSSLITLVGLYPPTSDLNIVAGWAVLVFILITYYKMKCGPIEYMKSFANPVLMAPLNIISEVATPVSMAFRHYGNVLSGSVISVLIASGLQGVTNIVFGKLPGILSAFPLFQVGIPAVLSIYFDVFSGCLQAYIFAMLSMMYISGGFPYELYMKKKNRVKA